MKGPFVPRYVRLLYRRVDRFLVAHVPHGNAALLFLAFAVGIGSGLGAVGFEALINIFRWAFGHVSFDVTLFGLRVPLGHLVALVGGGLLAGILGTTLIRASRGHGVPDVMASTALRGGRIRPRVAGDTAVMAGICIGSGGSAGPEGPIVQIGSAIGSAIGQIMRVSTDRLRVLVACGAAGGISAIFGAPLAGVMFSVEVILGDFGVQTLTPIILSSVLAAVTHQIFAGWQPRFDVPEHGMIGLKEVPLMIALGVVAAFLAVFFIRFLYGMEDRFKEWRFPRVLKPAVGMALAGGVALGFPEVLGDSYGSISQAFHGEFPLQVLFGIVLAKLLATSLVVSSGNVGGLFAPSLLIGAALGGLFGGVLEIVQPGEPGIITLYALVGMGAMIAGTTHAPITAILLVFEMTHDYAIVLPAMLAVATSVILSSRLQRESIYTLKLVRQGIHLKRGMDINVMSSMRVREVMRPATELVSQDLPFDRLLAFLEGSTHNTFCVVAGETLTGVISYQDIRTVLTPDRSPELSRLVVASDIATPNPVVVTPEETLNDAMRLFGLRDLSLLPVVESRPAQKLVGVLYRADVLNAYARALMERTPSESSRGDDVGL